MKRPFKQCDAVSRAKILALGYRFAWRRNTCGLHNPQGLRVAAFENVKKNESKRYAEGELAYWALKDGV